VLGETVGVVAALLGTLALATWPVATLATVAAGLVAVAVVRRSERPAADEQRPADVTAEARADPR
jgi:hypothetical protein